MVEIADSGTLIPEDQPEQLAQVLREFVGTPLRSAGDGPERVVARRQVPGE
ncbi:MAG: hypothetical protein QM650_03945 [Microlunatus sp.]